MCCVVFICTTTTITITSIHVAPFPTQPCALRGRPLRTASKEQACPPASCLALATGGTSRELEEKKENRVYLFPWFPHYKVAVY